MIEATSCGGVVIFRGKILVLYKSYKNKYEGWVLPKGTVEAGEEFKDTAAREVLEETGLHINIIDGFDCVSKYKIRDRIEKMVTIFVGTTKDTSTVIQQEEIEDYIWLTYDKAMNLLKFENDKNILRSAYSFLNEHNYI